MPRVAWKRVAAFYALACLWSWPFFFWRDALDWSGFPGPRQLGATLIMWGPGVAALACWAWFGAPERPGLLGGSPGRCLIAVASFALLVAADARADPEFAIAGLALLPLSLFRTLGEELGWRGYLQTALQPIAAPWRWVLVGLLWEAWHFTTRTWGRPFPQVVFVLVVSALIAVALSIVIGWTVERTGALLVAVAMHMWINAGLESLDGGHAYGAFAALAGFGILLLLAATWPRPRAREAAS